MPLKNFYLKKVTDPVSETLCTFGIFKKKIRDGKKPRSQVTPKIMSVFQLLGEVQAKYVVRSSSKVS